MQSRTCAAFRRGLIWAIWPLAAAYVIGLTVHGVAWAIVVNGWLGMLTVWAPAALCWLAVQRAGSRRPEVLLAAAAVTSYAAGNTYYVVKTVGGGSLPFPSPADLGYLCVYPLLLAALALTVRRHVRGLASSVWLDCAAGSLGAAAVLAVLLSPVLASATAGPLSLATIVAIAPPMFDLLLVATVAGIAGLGGVRMGSHWGLLVAGLLIFSAADVVYGLQVTADTYVIGTPLDSGWAIGLVLMSLWVDSTAQDRQPGTSC
ncbi:MAG TPA: hypothetical protein VIJ15_15170 [Dermatophilaceae bacterium]